jgi:flagellar export protein FliJ
MNRRSLQQLIEQAQRVRDDAAVRVAGARSQVGEAQRTLDLLASCLSDHLQRTALAASIEAPVLRIRAEFIRKLDTAVGEQTRQRDAMEQAARRRREELIDTQRRLLAFKTLHARRESARALTAQRADQRHTDEIAAQTSGKHARGSMHDR